MMMNHPSRREMIGALTAAGIAAAMPPWTGRAAAPADHQRLPHGYLLVQDVGTYNSSKFGTISTADEAEPVFAHLQSRGVHGVEFDTSWFDAHDMRAHEAVARVAAKHKVELWATSWRLVAKARAFKPVPDEFQAHVMEADGRIVPAMSQTPGEKPAPIFDVLNPDAVDWLCQNLAKRYYAPMKGLLAGRFLNEDCLPYLDKPSNDHAYKYWRNATYSPAVLKQWQQYCRAHDVTEGGRVVDRFPVHDPAMAAGSEGRAAVYPGWNVPAVLKAGQRFVDLPTATGVWRHWFDFTCGAFLENWIGKLSKAAREANAGESRWRGSVYFGLHHWSLPYEQVRDPSFAVPQKHHWGAWGRQRGIDLERLAADAEIDGIICETYPPVEANLEGFVAEYARITRAAGKTFGVMLHRDDKWPLKPEEEAQRWALLNKYRPTIVARYPRALMVPGNEFYSEAAEAAFDQAMARYRRS